MSAVIATPDLVAAAGMDLASIRSSLDAAQTAAAIPTRALLPAAADEVSTCIAHLFSQHADAYQAVADQAATFHEEFLQKLTAAANSYAGAEATNAASLEDTAGPAAGIAFPTPEEILVQYSNFISILLLDYPLLYDALSAVLLPIFVVPAFAFLLLYFGMSIFGYIPL